MNDKVIILMSLSYLYYDTAIKYNNININNYYKDFYVYIHLSYSFNICRFIYFLKSLQ